MAKIKGIMMSIDSILTTILVIAVLGLLVFKPEYTEAESSAFALVSQRMQDSAVLAMHLRKTPSDFGLKDVNGFTKKYWKCEQQVIPKEESSEFNSKPDLEKLSYCEEI